jgi:hypothetical protein
MTMISKRAEHQRVWANSERTCCASWSLRCSGLLVDLPGGTVCESCLLSARVSLRALTGVIIDVACAMCREQAPGFGGPPVGPLCCHCIDRALVLVATLRMMEADPDGETVDEPS